jgi:hypothetical protein
MQPNVQALALSRGAVWANRHEPRLAGHRQRTIDWADQ